MPKFSSSPIYDYFRRLSYNELPIDEKDALAPRHDVTNLIKKDIAFRLLNQKFFILFIVAKGGEGKSNIAKYFYKFVDAFINNTTKGKEIKKIWEEKGYRSPKYAINNWSFTDQEFLSISGNAAPLEVVVKDEDYETSAQVGGRAEKERKRMLLSRIRAMQINYILNDPIFDDGKISYLFHYKIFANDISYEDKKNRGIVYLQDYDGVWRPIGHIITEKVELAGYDEKKEKQLIEIQKMQQPEYKRKKLEKIVKAMVFWKGKEGIRDDIREYTKNCWNGIIQRRLDEMGEGGLRAGTELKQIKDAIDAYYPTKKAGRE